ncbi:hypothetical protein AB0L41_47890 [Amycolatopsis mediterranei]
MNAYRALLNARAYHARHARSTAPWWRATLLVGGLAVLLTGSP